MFGVDEFTAIINTPNACILAVSGIQAVPVVKNGAVVPGNVMKVTLSCDHRVVDGALGAAFLQTLKSITGRTGKRWVYSSLFLLITRHCEARSNLFRAGRRLAHQEIALYQ
jgi:hypothetical protein